MGRRYLPGWGPVALLLLLVAPALAGPWEAPALGGARVGFLALRVATGEVLEERSADERFVPASALKVLTAAAALEALGPEHRFRTLVRRVGEDLVLEGGGDPTLRRADLEALAARVAARGIRRADRVIADPSALPGPPFGPGWAWEDVPAAFSAEVSGLTLDRGTVTVRIRASELGRPPRVEGELALVNQAVTVAPGGASTWELLRLPGRPGTLLQGDLPADEAPSELEVAVPEPARRAGEVFAEALRAAGVEAGEVRVSRAREGEIVAEHLSAPLPEILAEGLAKSDNLVLECVFRSTPSPLGHLPVPADSLRMVDGSGLSRYDLATPRAFVETLRSRPALSPLLPGPGQGTLAKRLAGLPVRAKTGSMGGVSSLVGYVHPDEPARRIAFALLSNGFVAPGRELKAFEDALVEALAAR